MPRWLLWVLLPVFVVHLAAFGLLYVKRRQAYYAVLTVTFALLIGAFSLRLFAPGWQIAGVGAHWYLRVPAWFGAATSLTMLARRLLARRAARRAARS